MSLPCGLKVGRWSRHKDCFVLQELRHFWTISANCFVFLNVLYCMWIKTGIVELDNTVTFIVFCSNDEMTFRG